MSMVLFPEYINQDPIKEQNVNCLTSILPPGILLNATKYRNPPKYWTNIFQARETITQKSFQWKNRNSYIATNPLWKNVKFTNQLLCSEAQAGSQIRIRATKLNLTEFSTAERQTHDKVQFM